MFDRQHFEFSTRLEGVIRGAALIMAVIAAPARADRIYHLINNPEEQEGHALTGTIVTTDEAPLDRVLETAEILDWQWSISGPHTFSASRQEFMEDATSAVGVRITAASIDLTLATMMQPDLSELVLSRITAVGRGHLGHELHWSSSYSLAFGQFRNYRAAQLFGDAIQGYWSSSPTSVTAPTWTIALAVPEFSGIGPCILASLGIAIGGRRRAPPWRPTESLTLPIIS